MSTVTEVLNRYLATFDSISGSMPWYQSPTALRFAALHLSAASTESSPDAIADDAAALAGCFDRIDPLRAYCIPMAGLANARRVPSARSVELVSDLMLAFTSAPKPLGRTNRARAVPLLAYTTHEGGFADAVDRLGYLHRAWNARHRWMTTGRHYSLAAIAVATGADPETSAGAAEQVHDLLGDYGFWHEWDASILLSLSPEGPEVATQRYLDAVEGFTGGSKPPPVARDDLAVVSLGDGDAGAAGALLAEFNQQLRQIRPRYSAQLALASAAGLVLSTSIADDGWQRNVVDGFGIYAYSESLREEASD